MGFGTMNNGLNNSLTQQYKHGILPISLINIEGDTMLSKNCVICGTEFFVYPSTQATKTCGRKCSAILSNQTRTTRISKLCVICGERFEVTKSRADITKACSKKCASILGGRTQDKKVTLVCVTCGDSFKVPPCRATTAKTCSHDCAVWVRAKSTERKALCVCNNCGKEFEVPQSNAGRRVYCSEECKQTSKEFLAAKADRMLGDKNPSWKCGITPESIRLRNLAEYKIWRSAVFARDDYTCQDCGERGGELNAHHIKPFAKYPALRLAIDNGTTLCELCHKKKHRKINNKPRPREHTGAKRKE